jgi:5'-3' exonuclease
MDIKVNLICDGNYIFYKSVFVLKKTSNINDDLLKLMKKDYDFLSKTYPYNNIYFISDCGKSWRKEIQKDYKGNRKKDESVNWSELYEQYDKFKEELKQKPNCKMIEVDGLEGDDIIATIVNKSNKKNYSNVIIANDSDLHQLLNFNLDLNYINVMWNYKFQDNIVYVPNNYSLFTSKVEQDNSSDDIFNLNNNCEFVNFVNGITSKSKIKQIDVEKILFCKIITGDVGDNIPGVVKLKDGKFDSENGKGIGKTGAETCYSSYKDIYPEYIDFESDKYIDRCAEICMYHKKIKDTEIKDIIKNRIKINLNMIYLNEKYVPSNLIKKVNEKINI